MAQVKIEIVDGKIKTTIVGMKGDECTPFADLIDKEMFNGEGEITQTDDYFANPQNKRPQVNTNTRSVKQ